MRKNKLSVFILCLIVFGVLILHVPTTYANPDPTIIATTSGGATYNMYQGKVFKVSSGNYFVFYSDDTNLVYKCSSNGATFGSAQTVRACSENSDFSVYWDGTHIHYTYSGGAVNQPLYYRRGTLNGTGTGFDWDDDEQTVLNEAGVGYVEPSVTADSSGCPWIGYLRLWNLDWPYVIKSSLNNGTWSTASGFPYQLSATSDLCWRVSLVKLSSSQVYAVYASSGSPIKGQLWNSTAWGSEESVSSSNIALVYSCFSAVSLYNDDIHLVFIKYSFPHPIIHVKRTYGTGWGSETIVRSSARTVGVSLIFEVPVNKLWAIFVTSDYDIAYRACTLYPTPSEWDSTDLILRDGTSSENPTYPNAFYKYQDDKIIVIWNEGTSSPYSLMFEAFAEYEYTFNGVYDEDTGLLKGASERAVNVTAYFEGAFTETFEVNGTYKYMPLMRPLYFYMNVSNPRQYWLSIENRKTIYIFDTSTTTYVINFLDLAGVLDENPYVEAKRYINGTLHIVEKRKVDVERKVVMNLKNGEKYTLTIEDGTSYTFGDLTMTDDTTVRLTLKGVDFPPDFALAYKYVRAYAYRENTTIVTTYEDTKFDTYMVEIWIKFENGTVAYYQNYTDTNSFVDEWNGADPTLDYYELCQIMHNQFGVLDFATSLPAGWGGSPFNLDILGFLPFGVVTSAIIPAVLIIGATLLFSSLTVGVGGIFMCAIASFVTAVGWYPIDPSTLVICWIIAILLGIVQARKRLT